MSREAILVTGATGMTGSFVVRELQARGKAVRVLARPESTETAMAEVVALGTPQPAGHAS